MNRSGDTVAKSALRLQTFLASPAGTPGLLSELRTLNVNAPPLGPLGVVLEMTGAEGSAQLQRWLAVARAMAILGPKAHRRQLPLGAALQIAGLSRLRFERLLAAPPDMFDDMVLRAARTLRAKRVGADFIELAQLMVWRESDWAQDLRLRMARDYLRAERGNSFFSLATGADDVDAAEEAASNIDSSAA